MVKKYKIKIKGKILSTKYTKSGAKISLRRIYAGYMGSKKLPKRVPKKFGTIVKIK